METKTNYHVGNVLGQYFGCNLVDCVSCGYLHLWPFPKLAEDYYDPQRYQAEHKRPHASRLDEEKADKAWHDLQWDERLTRIKQEIGSHGRMLDVGSGHGWFMMRAVERGWVTHGVEPTMLDADYGNLDDVPFSASFDAVHCSLVLEHVPSPAKMLMQIHNLIRPGGVLCVVVPNDAPLLLSGKDWCVREEHLNYFSHSSIRRLVEMCEFKVVDQWASMPLEALSFLNYANRPRLGHVIHHGRMYAERLLAFAGLNSLKLRWYRRLARQGRGRASVVFAMKP